jgi:hypothetical protein
MGSINSRPLKAFVRYDGSGRIVAGSLILRKNKPKVGKWKEIQAYECCFLTTTTTTTTAEPLLRTNSTFADCTANCGEICEEPYTYYDVYMTQSCIDSFPSLGCEIWLDEEGTEPFPNSTYNIGNGECIRLSDGIIDNIG